MLGIQQVKFISLNLHPRDPIKNEDYDEEFRHDVVWKIADRQNVTRSVGPLGLWFAVMSSDKTGIDLRKWEGASQK